MVSNSSKFKGEILCISYFDQILGPNQLFCNEALRSDGSGLPNLNNILEFNDEPGSFIFAFRKYQTINFIFYIDSKFARGDAELLMITYMIRAAYFRNEIIDVFKFLDSKNSILEDYAEDLKNLEELPAILHDKNKSSLNGNIIELGSEGFKSKFLDLHKKYLKKLSPNFGIESPINIKQVTKKIFIFGERYVGKTTFLKNVELIQFHNQKNNDLPTRIYELVIDNIEIITYDCIDRNFECERCKNFGGCIKNAQCFILIINANDRKSLIKAKEKFQRIIDRYDEVENHKIPLLIIGNKFDNKEDFDSEFLNKTFNLKELKELGIKVKYSPINIMQEKKEIIGALRWLITNMI
jgi:GTPase SAR1 family protein